MYGKVYAGVIRSTFVIDGDGVIRVARIHPRYSNHERFLGILVQAGSHGGAHRAAKAAELVYCDVFDRDAQHVGKDKTSSPRCALPSSRLCMADPRTCPEASRLYMAGQSAETVGRGVRKASFLRNRLPYISEIPPVASRNLPYIGEIQPAFLNSWPTRNPKENDRAIVHVRNIIPLLSCSDDRHYATKSYDYRPSKRFPESLPSC